MTQLVEYIKMALKNIWGNKARTFLTMLGIIIGISSVILIISIGSGATNMIASQLGDIGKGQIAFGTTTMESKYSISEDEIEEIRKIKGVKAVAAQNYYEASTSTKKDDFAVDLVTLNPDGFGISEFTYVAGGAYTEQDADAGKAVCVISDKDAMKLFGSTNVLGMDLEITCFEKDMTVSIVGITKTENDNQIISAYESPSVEVIIPPAALSNSIGYDESQELYQFYVLKEDKADAEKLVDEVIDYLEVKHHCKGDNIYIYQSFDDVMNTVNSVMNLITVFVAFVASVSLLVGGIGVMNIMLVSVTERTREIGIRKALGAKTGSITVQFLAESAFITLIGGVIGILFGLLGACLISKIIALIVPTMKFTPVLKLSTILIATTFSSVVGIFFGIYPARKAAKMKPIEALRYN